MAKARAQSGRPHRADEVVFQDKPFFISQIKVNKSEDQKQASPMGH